MSHTSRTSRIPRTARALRVLVAASAATAVTGAMLTPSSEAAAPPAGKTVAQGLLSPLSVAVNDQGHVFYSENFAGKLLVKRPGKAAKVIYSGAPGNEVGAISTDGKAVYFVDGARVMKRNAAGKVRAIADIGAFEAAKNPDQIYTYGPLGLSPECATAWPTGEGAPPNTYNGGVESHPYATAVDDGTVYVADAAANAVFKIRKGRVSTVALLPPVTVTITPQMAAGAGIPECAIGKQYAVEGVPTDVEVHDGKLFVSSLPGGPEDGSFPGSVYKINPVKHRAKRIATGFVSATGVAVADDGTVYVSELFAGKVTRISPKGRRSTFLQVPFPSAVEVDGKRLFVSENGLSGLSGQPGDVPAGKVVRYLR
ncbi:ScyD/ScyE family protein [Nocardioides ginsengisoli]|uniref:ScyD/ScyE family protein n=1 Tax=Nocardioides ginsengisoli TaxID=363868 RepID=A0ABW3VW64_9ACTN